MDSYAVLRFSGEGASASFAAEAGGHRFQRIPPTERKGRVHSSTVTVAVLSEPQETELKISPHELVFETYKTGGPGGQHKNKTESAVRVTHTPTGIQACSTLKSQHQNKELAIRSLKARIIESQRNKVESDRNSSRKQQVGSGQRSDKIRTVAYQRGRVENHKNGKRMSIREYERGEVDSIH